MGAKLHEPYISTSLNNNFRGLLHSDGPMLYAEVLLPLAVRETYHYRLTSIAGDKQDTLVGHRVVVSFGRKRFYTGIIIGVSDTLPEGVDNGKIKDIDSLPDTHPLLRPQDLDIWRWLASYYHCTLGQVMRAALPGGLIPDSQSILLANEDFSTSLPLSRSELEILDLLSPEPKGLTMEALRRRMGYTPTKALTHLIELGAIYTEEIVRSRYRPKLETYLRLTPVYQTEEALSAFLETLRRAPRQQEALTRLISLIKTGDLSQPVLRKLITQDMPTSISSALNRLVEQGIIESMQLTVSRLDQETTPIPSPALELAQATPLTRPVTLLYTDSRRDKEGEILAQIAYTISQSKQVLLLSPTADGFPSDRSFLSRLERCVGYPVYYYHPYISESKRTELYLRLSESDIPCVVVGSRPAVFLPMRQLGLIIVDEEQEYLYKQQYAPPYYHARDVALYLGAHHRVPILLCSVTPSAEVLFNVLRDKYAIIRREAPAHDTSPAALSIIDLGKLREQRQMRPSDSLSPQLLEAIHRTISEGQRVLVLQNRKGYAPYLICSNCGERPLCPHCDVSLSYYASHRQLRCGYCGYTSAAPTACPSCGQEHSRYSTDAHPLPALRPVGYGTERIEEELSLRLPEARLMRIDADTMQTVKRRLTMIEQIDRGEVDIIIGSQLIKSQPIWDNIGLVAIPQLDSLLGYPDFRTTERAYQLLHQLTLSATRAGQPPRLMIQTLSADQPFLVELSKHNYSQFIKGELAQRQGAEASAFIQLNPFPPFVRMTYIRLRATDENILEHIGNTFVEILQRHLPPHSVSPLQKPSVARIDMQYHRLIVCRRPYHTPFVGERTAWAKAEAELYSTTSLSRKVQICYDVDPL